MKQFFAISLLMCLCFQSVLKLGIVAWYEANKTYVSNVLCENKAKPQMKCNGKCYLRKQLNKTENNQQNRQLKASQTEWVEFIPVNGLTFSFHALRTPPTYIDIYKTTTGHNPLSSIFHPPPVA